MIGLEYQVPENWDITRRNFERIQACCALMASMVPPPGGAAGEVLAKASDADYDTEWVAAPSAFAFFNG